LAVFEIEAARGRIAGQYARHLDRARARRIDALVKEANRR